MNTWIENGKSFEYGMKFYKWWFQKPHSKGWNLHQ